MTAFPPEIIARIKDETDIVELVGRYVRLKPAGASWKGLCPFHNEKSPSFNVNPARQTYKCFGCGEGGDAISFLMAVEAIAFPEAVETLARNLDIDLARYLEAGADEGDKRAFFRANEAAAGAFREAYQDDRLGRIARDYLEGRGFRPEVLDRFGVGWAPAGDWLPRRLAKVGVSEELAISSGLVRRSERGQPFAYFRERVIFPIRNIARQVAGFGGRVVGPGEPKYINSGDSPYYNKGKLLYGFDASRMVVARRKTAVLVEGYLDLIALAQAGIANVVATCGTAFTPDQARLLRRGADKVVMLFDGDRAGRQAAVKACHLTLAAGQEAEVACLPAGVDPADLVMQGGTAAVNAVLDGAVPYLQFLRDAVSAAGDDRHAIERGSKQALITIAEVADPIRRELMLQETARLFGLPEAVLRQTLADAAAGKRPLRQGEASAPAEPEMGSMHVEGKSRRNSGRNFTGIDRGKIEKDLFAYILRDVSGRASRYFAENGDDLSFSGDVSTLALTLRQWASSNQHLNPSDFVQLRWHEQDADYRNWVTDVLERHYIAEEGDIERAVRDCMERLRTAPNDERG